MSMLDGWLTLLEGGKLHPIFLHLADERFFAGASTESSDLESDTDISSSEEIEAAAEQCPAGSAQLGQRYPVQSRTTAEASGLFRSTSPSSCQRHLKSLYLHPAFCHS